METVRLFRNYEPTTSPHSRLRRLVKTSRLRLTGVLQTLETSGTVREGLLLGVPAHICAVGLYFRGDHLRFARYSPPKTKPCSRKHQDETVRKSSPQGVTIPNAKRASLRPPEFAQTVFTCHFYDLLHNGTDCNTPCECNDLHSCNCKLVHSSFSDLKMNEDSK